MERPAQLWLRFHLTLVWIPSTKKLDCFCLRDSDPASGPYRLTVVFESVFLLDCGPVSFLSAFSGLSLADLWRSNSRVENCLAVLSADCYLSRSWIFYRVRLSTYILGRHAQFFWRGRLSFSDGGWSTPTIRLHLLLPTHRSPRIKSRRHAHPFHPVHKDAVNSYFSWIITI